MEDLTQVTKLLENLISEEVERRTETLKSERDRANGLKTTYIHYIRLIINEYNIDLDAQVKKLQEDHEHSEFCDAMAGRYSPSETTFFLGLELKDWKTIKEIFEEG